MTGPCKDCWNATLRSHWGGFSVACIGCCARLVLSCSPDRNLAEAMLQHLTVRQGGWTRREVLDAVRELKASRTSPSPSGQANL